MDTFKRSLLTIATGITFVIPIFSTTGCSYIQGIFSSQTIQIGLRVLILEMIKQNPALAQVFTVMMGELNSMMKIASETEESFDVLTDKLLNRYSDYLTPLERQKLKQEFKQVYNQTVAFSTPPVAGGIPLTRENLAFRQIQNDIEQALLEQDN